MVHNATVYARMASGLRRIDVIYRRIDDDFTDPVTFREDSALGASGLFHAYRAGNVVMANAPGTGVADDKAVYAFIPDIIRYFLGEEPILANVDTHLCRRPDDLAHTLDNLQDLVVKEVGGSGGYGMLVGPQSTAREREAYADRLRADPDNFIAQPVLPLSRAACFVDGSLQPRHVDVRPFTLHGNDGQHVVPGGLCRVALRLAALVEADVGGAMAPRADETEGGRPEEGLFEQLACDGGALHDLVVSAYVDYPVAEGLPT